MARNLREENMSIARIWGGITLVSNADKYLEYLDKMVIPACQMAEGNEGLIVMKECHGELSHFLVLSVWASNDALAKYVGATDDVVDPTPEEKNLLIAFESNPRHYKIVCALNDTP